MKKVISILICLCLILSTFTFLGIPANAESEGYFTYAVSNGRATITDCSTSISGAVTIPSTLGGYPVTSIGDWAFSDCQSLTSITIPDSVTSIGYYAFCDCDSLTSVTIPDSVTSIGAYAFEYCTSLTSITIPDSVTSIGDYAFSFCTSLTSVTIPDSVTRIGANAFFDCTSLTSVYITDLAKWCKIRFANGSANPLYLAKELYLNNELVTDLTIPDSVTSIGDDAFLGCESLTSVTIPDSVTSIGYYAFSGCSSLKKVNITDIAKWCEIEFCGDFYDGTGVSNPLEYAKNLYLNNELVTNLVIPDGVENIYNDSFKNCSSLTSVTIPNSVTRIGWRAFISCEKLSSVTIPNSVTNIGDMAFYGCNIKELTIADGSKSVLSNIAQELYCENTLEKVIIPDSVTAIGDDAFANCTKLNSVILPSNLQIIGNNAFYNCAVNEITIPKTVKSIGDYAIGYYNYESIVDNVLIDDFVIKGYKNTVAETYANENKITFVALDGTPTQPSTQPSTQPTTKPTTQPTVKPDEPTVPLVCVHTTVIKNFKKSTYFAKGYTGDKECAKCGVVTTKGTATDKLTIKAPKFKLTKGKKLFKVKYTAVSGASGFQVRYKLKGKWKTKTYSSTKTVTKVIKKLKKGNYQVQIRAMVVKGKQKAYSAWSKTKKVKVK